MAETKEHFFTHNKVFYKTLAHLMLVVALQNVVTYSVNMADNIMLGVYSQVALSGAAAVNMIHFMLQCAISQFAESSVVIGSQYWGLGRVQPVRLVSWSAVRINLIIGIILFVLTSIFPSQIVSIFTDDPAIIKAGCEYLSIIRFTYPLFSVSYAFMCALRTVGTVNISFALSVVSLVLNCAINYTLIFGPANMGIRGAAIGTITSRAVEFAVLLIYIAFIDKKLRLFKESPLKFDKILEKDYYKQAIPAVAAGVLWACATPIQTAILGQLSSDAIAANSASTTMFQYLKVITQGEASAGVVIIGRAVSTGDVKTVKAYSRTLQVIFIAVAFILAIAIYFIRIPILSLYDLTDNAREMAEGILIVLCVVMAGMGYQMPSATAMIKGGGDARYNLILNVISTWGVVIPLGLVAAFWFEWPVIWVVAALNADQIFKCIPVAVRVNNYKWMHILTRDEEELAEAKAK